MGVLTTAKVVTRAETIRADGTTIPLIIILAGKVH
jgi:hypothetical protein